MIEFLSVMDWGWAGPAQQKMAARPAQLLFEYARPAQKIFPMGRAGRATGPGGPLRPLIHTHIRVPHAWKPLETSFEAKVIFDVLLTSTNKQTNCYHKTLPTVEGITVSRHSNFVKSYLFWWLFWFEIWIILSADYSFFPKLPDDEPLSKVRNASYLAWKYSYVSHPYPPPPSPAFLSWKPVMTPSSFDSNVLWLFNERFGTNNPRTTCWTLQIDPTTRVDRFNPSKQLPLRQCYEHVYQFRCHHVFHCTIVVLVLGRLYSSFCYFLILRCV